MDRNLALEFVRVTEAAAISSAKWMGRGDGKAADQAAVDAMRRAMEKIEVQGTVVIGEGERDEAPMLYIGEKFGSGDEHSPKIDVALDPLEGTNLCATGHGNALSVMAVAEKGQFLHAPDTYMDKIAVGPDCKGLLHYEMSAEEKIKTVAQAKRKKVADVTVIILDRPRHKELIESVRRLGCRINLIDDGDVSAAIAVCNPETGIDLLLGSGGAPEGVISAAALKCLGGDFIGKLQWRNSEEKLRASKMGVENLDRVYGRDDLAQGHVMFVATGVTDGPWLKGVNFTAYGCTSHSIVMRSETGTIREIHSRHSFTVKPMF